MPVRFGPSGNSKKFYEEGYKSSLQMPQWLGSLGLDAYEYQCNKGVKISREKAEKLGEEARKHDIKLSIHAPYYINLAAEGEKRANSVGYIIDTLHAAKWMGAERIVVHPGSCGGKDRAIAFGNALNLLKHVIKEADSMGLGNISICPETLGKMNQLGSLDEVLELCLIDERLIPAVDFAHIHARGLGCLKTKKDFEAILDSIGNKLGSERLKRIHIHFSRVEFTSGGEKKHWTLDDSDYGPEFEPLCELIYEKGLEPVIICESRDKMAEDAVKMKEIFKRVAESYRFEGCE